MAEPMECKWTWYWRTSEDGAVADCGIVAETRPGHAYSICRCPRYVTEDRWKEFARHICDLHNASIEPVTAHIAIGSEGMIPVLVRKISG